MDAFVTVFSSVVMLVVGYVAGYKHGNLIGRLEKGVIDKDKNIGDDYGSTEQAER